MAELSWPAIIAMILYGLNAVISAAFVGRFAGETALAGVSVAYPLTQLSAGLGSLIGVGAVLSIAIGRQDQTTQQRLLGNVNSLSLITAAVYMLLGLAFSAPLLKLMGGEGQVLALGDSYFRITILGAWFWIYGLAANMIIRAEGKMKSAAVIMGLGLLIDILANYLLVGVFACGIAGSAWATNIGMLSYTLLGWLYFGKHFSSFKAKVFSLYWDAAIVKSVISLGMSSFIMLIMNLVQGIVVFNALARYGTVLDMAFYGAVYRIFIFGLTPIFGLMRALQPVVGINYGAGQYERVITSYKLFTVASALLTMPLWIIVMIAPASVLSLMLPAQIYTGEQLLYFRIYMAVIPLLSMIFMAMTFFPAIGKGKPAAIIGIARQLVFYVPVMLILPKMIGVSGIYYGSLAIDALIVLWTAILVKMEFTTLRLHSQPAPARAATPESCERPAVACPPVSSHNITGRKKWYGLALTAIILCLAGGMLWQKSHRVTPAAETKIPLVQTLTVGAAGAASLYTYAGEVRGRYESQLSFQVGGKLIKRNVELGSAVQAGELLMQLDPQDFNQMDNSNAAQLAAAQAQLTLAENNLNRYRQLYAQAAVSRAQLDQYQSAYDIARAAVRQTAAQYEQGANKLDYTRLYADQPGVIAAVNAETGQVVSAGQSVLTLVRDGQREIEINIPENRLQEFRDVSPCKATFWALPGVSVDGAIREIAPMANAITRTYKVRVTLVNPPPEVKLGMTAAVTITGAGQQAAAIAIPRSALYQTGDVPGVWVIKNDTVTWRPVTVGVGNNDTIPVLTGLQPGETIVTAGVHKLREGQKVRTSEGGGQ